MHDRATVLGDDRPRAGHSNAPDARHAGPRCVNGRPCASGPGTCFSIPQREQNVTAISDEETRTTVAQVSFAKFSVGIHVETDVAVGHDELVFSVLIPAYVAADSI